MQTFVPFSDFEAAARSLDTLRLGKQRVEVIQIVRALVVPGYGWASHPAVLMWQGYEEALGRYGITTCDVWVEKGFGDTCAATIATDLRIIGVTTIRSYDQLVIDGALPEWLFHPAVLRSHQSALVRKDPDYYRPLFPDVPDDIPYVWPVRSPAVIEKEQRAEANARRREIRAVERAAAEAEKLRRRRSLAAKRGWRTRTTSQGASGSRRSRPDQSG